jgi:hypothetical protein
MEKPGRLRPYEALCVSGKIILKGILKKKWKGVDLINLTQVAGCCRHGGDVCFIRNFMTACANFGFRRDQIAGSRETFDTDQLAYCCDLSIAHCERQLYGRKWSWPVLYCVISWSV